MIAATSGTFYGVKMTAGDIYTIAGDGQATSSGNGGPATKAGVGPLDATVDSAGNVLIADNSDQIRVVAEHTGTFYGQQMTAGDIYAVAGIHREGDDGWALGTDGIGDGGPATKAVVVSPSGVSCTPSGSLLEADALGRIRSVSG
jgi:hypothetical protein